MLNRLILIVALVAFAAPSASARPDYLLAYRGEKDKCDKLHAHQYGASRESGWCVCMRKADADMVEWALSGNWSGEDAEEVQGEFFIINEELPSYCR